jgi:hypothetical protein
MIMLRIGWRTCPHCGRGDIYSSRPQTWSDKACYLFFLQVVRCHSCMDRFFRPFFLPSLAVPAYQTKKPSQTITSDEQRKWEQTRSAQREVDATKQP